jgi:hypothetical protein
MTQCGLGRRLKLPKLQRATQRPEPLSRTMPLWKPIPVSRLRLLRGSHFGARLIKFFATRVQLASICIWLVKLVSLTKIAHDT